MSVLLLMSHINLVLSSSYSHQVFMFLLQTLQKLGSSVSCPNEQICKAKLHPLCMTVYMGQVPEEVYWSPPPTKSARQNPVYIGAYWEGLRLITSMWQCLVVCGVTCQYCTITVWSFPKKKNKLWWSKRKKIGQKLEKTKVARN